MPSWPYSSQPQHHRVPPARVAQVWPPQAATLVQPLAAGVVTCCGRSWLVWLPMPSWPTPLSPQHHRVPSVRVAQVWSPPAVTLAQPRGRGGDLLGQVLVVVVPMPSWPSSLSPQHHRVPSVRVAQVWSPPAVTLVQPAAAGVVTCWGRSWLVLLPMPSWP